MTITYDDWLYDRLLDNIPDSLEQNNVDYLLFVAEKKGWIIQSDLKRIRKCQEETYDLAVSMNFGTLKVTFLFQNQQVRDPLLDRELEIKKIEKIRDDNLYLSQKAHRRKDYHFIRGTTYKRVKEHWDRYKKRPSPVCLIIPESELLPFEVNNIYLRWLKERVKKGGRKTNTRDFKEYLSPKGLKIADKLKEKYSYRKNRRDYAYILHALERLKYLVDDWSIVRHDNFSELHRSMNDFFGDIGGRPNLQKNLEKVFDPKLSNKWTREIERLTFDDKPS